MRLDIIDIDELPNFPVFARSSSFEFLDLLNHQVYIALSTRRQHQLRPIGTDSLLTFIAHSIWHNDYRRIPLSGRYAGSGNTSIASRTFNDAHARAQVATPLRLRDQEMQDTIFDAATGVKIFNFSNDGRFHIPNHA